MQQQISVMHDSGPQAGAVDSKSLPFAETRSFGNKGGLMAEVEHCPRFDS